MAASEENERAADQDEESSDAPDVTFDEDTQTITVQPGTRTTLAAVSRALADPDALEELRPGEWLLSANFLIAQGAAVDIAAPEVQRLKLRSDDDGFVWIKALGGDLTIEGTCITSWDPDRNSHDEDYEDGRSFVLARDGARMTIRNAELSHLGYAADESYGLAWRLAGTEGEIVNTTLSYNFYGLYSYEVSGLIIRGNNVHHNVRYGIDPHTRSNQLLIEDNVSHHNGKQGIILAEGCSDSIIRNNEVYNNGLHGIVLYQRSNNNLIENNISYANGLQGINVNDASYNIIRGNTVYDNTEDGIGVGQDAEENLVIGNTVYNNQQDGISIYSDATDTVVRENLVYNNDRYGIYVKSEGNAIGDGNEIYNNAIGIYLNVERPDDTPVGTNRIYDNRDQDVRIGD